MSLRRAVAEMDVTGVNVAAFCRDHGISREWFYTIRRRYLLEGEAGLEARSRVPHRIANRTSAAVEDRIVELRKRLADDGLDAGAVTIEWHLRGDGVADPPTVSTIWRILTRRGFITPDPSKAPNKTWRRFTAERGNELWQIDSTHTDLTDGTEAEIINILDDCTRLCPHSHAVEGATTANDAWDTFTAAVAAWGLPERVLSDNGPAFTAHQFTGNLTILGVATTRSRPYHPQTCGKVERFHQTLKRWLAAHPTATTISDLQDLCDTFVAIYNTQRPHRSIGRRTPIQAFNDTPRTGPATNPITTPTTVHTNTIDRHGVVEIPGPYAITLGAAYAGKTATTIQTGNRTHIFVDTQLARDLTINPTKRRQPLHNRPGRPTT